MAKRILAMTLVICMLVSALPLQALAAENELPFTETDTMNGENVVITITPSGDVNIEGTNNDNSEVFLTGSTSSNETTLKGYEFGSDGTEKEVSYNETTQQTGNSTVISGSETKDYIGDSPIDVPPVQGMPSVDLKEGETTSNTQKDLDEPAVSIDGDVPVDENDKDYDYTKVTVDYADRTVTGSLSTEESIVIDPFQSNLECPVAPEQYDGKQQPSTNDGTDFSKPNFEGLEKPDDKWIVDDKYIDGIKPDKDGYDAGYDFTWTGNGDSTGGMSAVVVTNAVTKIDENGNEVLDWEKSTFSIGTGKAWVVNDEGKTQGSGMILGPGQFALKYENNQYFYAYCMDASTSAQPNINRWYSLRNLESVIEPDEGDDNPNTYITKEQAGMIRAIANGGYWGTNGKDENGDIKYETDKDGNIVYQVDNEGNQILDEDNNPVPVIRQGSIERLKELLRDNYKEGDTITVNYPGHKDGITYDIYSMIDELTESEALAATQAAIWHFSNEKDVNHRGAVNGTVVGVLSAIKGANSGSFLMEYRPAYYASDAELGEGKDQDQYGRSDARLKALYECLLKLDPIYEDGANCSSSNLIPSQDVINDVTLAIKDKAMGFDTETGESFNLSANTDELKDNDIYNADVKFSLAFVPDQDSDDLLVCLVAGYSRETGEPIYMTDAKGEPIIRRLAGSNSEGENYGAILPDENGVYTLEGLQLGENVEHKFDIRLEGTQYLESGVYIYQAFSPSAGDVTRASSQTLVGMAMGDQHVTVTNSLTFSFDVNEQNHVVVEKFWSEEIVENDPPIIPNDPPVEPRTWNRPQVNRLANNDVVINEEPVPLASPAITGDSTGLWVALFLTVAFAMVAVNLFDKKRQHEAF